MSEPFSLDEFSKIANEFIAKIIDVIEAQDIHNIVDISVGDVVEIDILVEESRSGKMQYVLNKHNNYRQIWLVSPLSGPYHFDLLVNSPRKWVDRNGVILEELLTKELSQFINQIKFF